jgi:hypothetical protein
LAILAVQHTATGLSPVWSPSTPSGDSYPNTGAETLKVRNQGNAPVTVTVTALQKCSLQALVPLHVIPFTVPAAGLAAFEIGPLPFQFFNDPVTNLVAFTYSSTGQTPPAAPVLAVGGAGNPNGTYRCQCTFLNASGETIGGAEAVITVVNQQISWSAIPLGPALTTARKLYRILLSATNIASGTGNLAEQARVDVGTSISTADAAAVTETASVVAIGALRLVTTLADNTTTTFTDNVADAALGVGIPLVNTANVVQVAVTAL